MHFPFIHQILNENETISLASNRPLAIYQRFDPGF